MAQHQSSMIRQIREYDKKELERVCEIWLNESYRVHNFIDDYKNFWHQRKTQFGRDTIGADAYVWEDDGIIKGFIILRGNYISEMFVGSVWQSRGVGSSLIEYAKKLNKSLYTYVYVRNVKAVNWYFERGFVVDKVHEDEAKECGPKHLKYKMVWQKPPVPAGPFRA
jgi:putative acetyltransferase